MNRSANHIIQTNVLEVVVSQGGGYGLDEYYKQVIIPRLAEVFDRFCTQDEVVRIDRLEIQLQLNEGAFVKEEFEQQLVRAVSDKLQQVYNNGTRTGLLGAEYSEKNGIERGAVLSQPESMWQAFLHFLNQGSFPWWVDSDLGFETFEQEVLGSMTEASALPLFHKPVLTRLCYQFSFRFIEQFTRNLEAWHSGKIRYLKLIKTLVVESGNQLDKGLLKNYLSGLLKIINRQMPEGQAVREFVNSAGKERGLKNREKEELLRFIISPRDLPGPKSLSAILDSGNLSADEKALLLRLTEGDKSDDSALEGQTLLDEPTGLLEVNDSDCYFIPNAGIVILAPFLERFFANLGLTEGKSFKSIQAQTRAIHLLNFLVEGRENPPEHRLVLLKLLCGTPINFPVEREVSFSDTEKTECVVLLQSVIEHWGALKNTSADGLREGFLQREGKLSKQDKGWHLQIQQETYDILLNQLSWVISIWSAAWMNGEKLTVDWI